MALAANVNRFNICIFGRQLTLAVVLHLCKTASARGTPLEGIMRILVVDDCETWRRFASSALEKQPKYQVLDAVSDGLEAVRKARELEPDLILLDIALPTLNGIEAARRIQKVSPTSRILFFSSNHSLDVIGAALSNGAGYVV